MFLQIEKNRMNRIKILIGYLGIRNVKECEENR